MSVRKEYSVLVNGESVFSGSFASANMVYEAFNEHFARLCESCSDSISRDMVREIYDSILIAFKPVLK